MMTKEIQARMSCQTLMLMKNSSWSNISLAQSATSAIIARAMTPWRTSSQEGAGAVSGPRQARKPYTSAIRTVRPETMMLSKTPKAAT